MKHTVRQALLWTAVLGFASGCEEIVAPEAPHDFGLTLVEIEITPEHLGLLNTNVFNRRDVSAAVTIAGESWDTLLRYSGQTSINRPKKSYNIEFVKSRFREHREYKLSAQTGDVTALNPLAGPFAFERAGLMVPEVEPAVLYLNGELQGLYFLIEPIDEDFFVRRGQVLGTLYEAKGAAADFTYDGGYDVRLGFESRGDKEDFFGELERLLEILDTTAPEQLPQRLERILEVDNYLRYLAVSVLVHNSDGYFNNFRMHIDPSIGRFQFIPWDFDRLFVKHPVRSSIFGANALTARLLQVPQYRLAYRDLLDSLLESELQVNELNEFLDETAVRLEQAYNADRFLTASGISIREHAERVKQFNREWFEKIRQDLELLR